MDHLIEVESSGTGAWHVGEDADPRMRRTAAKHGLTLHHPAQAFRKGDLSDSDIIFAMDRGHYREIRALAKRALPTVSSDRNILSRLYLFRQFDPEYADDGTAPLEGAPDVPDPYYGGDHGFEKVYQMVERTCRRILDEIERGALP